MYGANNNDILDIEELMKNGINKEFCPFYLQRNKLQKCEIVFLPYNYIFDHRFRSALKIDLKASNAVLLIDEAHNILNSLESAKTFELSYKILEDSIGEIKNLKTVVEKHDCNSKLSYMELKEEENILVNIKNYLKKRFQPKTSSWPNIGQKLNPEEFFKIFFLGSREDDQKRIDEGNKISIDGLTPKNLDIHIDRLNRIESEFVDLTNKSTILTSYKEFLELFEILYKNYTENKDDPVKIKSSHIFNYKIFIHDEDDPNDTIKGKGMNSQIKNRVLSLFCFNPGYAFNEILEARNNGIIITSGTLSPIEGLESELKCQFAIKLENKHVIDQNQVHFSILPYSPRIKNLTYSLDSSNRNNINMQEDLGNTIIDLCKITPGGVLVFFTAFHYLKSTVCLWQEKNILNQIEKYKEIFNDTQNADKNKILLESFRKNSSTKGYRGGILFSVLKGKCSEGIDFSDDLARLVIVIGIPYANLGDVKVQLKKEYLGESHNNTFRKITPSQWYTEEATRAVNQALGRVIRHVDDYGVMVLIDQRYIELNNKKYFSSWLRQIVKKYGNSDNCEIFSDVSKFFSKMTSI
jgi:regulator of telomere elongation helicase 1